MGKQKSDTGYLISYFVNALGVIGLIFWICFTLYMLIWIEGLDRFSRENLIPHTKYIFAFIILLSFTAFMFLSPERFLEKLFGVKTELAKIVRAISGIIMFLLAIIYQVFAPKSFGEKIIERGIYYETRGINQAYISKKMSERTENIFIFENPKKFGEMRFVLTNEEILKGDVPEITSVFPLSPPSEYEVILCHAGFTWISYRTDRFGFRNKDSVWDEGSSPENTVIILGGDFAHGVCAEDGNTIADILRERTGKTVINLAGKDDSLILSFAKLVEFGGIKKAKNIILMFSGKDLMRIKDEWRQRILREYLINTNFSQNITKIKDKVDRTILAKEKPEMSSMEKKFFTRKEGLFDRIVGEISELIADLKRNGMNQEASCPPTPQRLALNLKVRFRVSLEKIFKPYSIAEIVKYIKQDPEPDDQTLALFQLTIKRIKEEVEKRNENSKITFVYLPDSFSVFRKFKYGKEEFFRILKTMNIDVIDVETLLSEEEKRKLFLVDMEDFYSGDGQRKIAEVLQKMIFSTRNGENLKP